MPTRERNPLTILMADDDADDRYLTRTAFEENDVACRMLFAEDGTEVFDFLNKTGKFETLEPDLPNIIMLDLNMPKKDGKQVLQEIKNSPEFRHIPVIIFTTSKSPEDIRLLYKMGASSFITKPSSFDKLLEVTKSIGKYWVDTATVL